MQNMQNFKFCHEVKKENLRNWSYRGEREIFFIFFIFCLSAPLVISAEKTAVFC